MIKRHVMIVDDARDVRRVLRAGLETLGSHFKVTDMPSGEEAMLVISHQPVDLLVADVRLPGISGLELKKRAQAINPRLKLILITGMTDPIIRRQITEARADAVFYKPIEMGDFLDTARQLLDEAGHPAPVAGPSGRSAAQAAPTVVKQPASAGIAQPPAPAKPAPPPVVSLHDRNDQLRKRLQAVCALVLDGRARTLAQSGDLPTLFADAHLIPSLIAAVGATIKAGQSLKQPASESFLYLRSVSIDLVLAPLGASAVLLLVFRPFPALDDIGKVWAGLQPALLEMARDLEQSVPSEPAPAAGPAAPHPVKPAFSSAAEASPSGTGQDLDQLFRNASKERYHPTDVDAFWESLIEQSDQDNKTSPDGLSFEQARRLGLLPKD